MNCIPKYVSNARLYEYAKNLKFWMYRCEEREEREDEFLTVIVSDPHKVGEGMSSYMAYKVSTRYSGIKPISAFGRKKIKTGKNISNTFVSTKFS
jgi:hypothetical protein